MNPNWPDYCFEHYERFLRKASAREIYSLDNTSLQIWRYEDVFEGCSVLCSVGFAQFSSRLNPDRHEEIVVAVDSDTDAAMKILATTLFYLGESVSAIPVLGSKGGVVELDSDFVERHHKDAFYFTEPFPFPDEFQNVSGSGASGSIFMGVFIDAREHEFLKQNGAGAFEDKLEAGNVDPFCLDRPSVV